MVTRTLPPPTHHTDDGATSTVKRGRLRRLLPPAIHWGVTLAPLGLAGLITATAPWMLVPIAATLGLYGIALSEPWRSRPPRASERKSRRVAIIGAGPSGLTTLKEFTASGHDALCFEAGNSVGGVFAQCYDGTRLTSSPAVTAFSDFPPERGDHQHWSKREYVDYLERYTENFALRDRIRLRNRVLTTNYEEGAGWTLRIRTEDGERLEGPFDTLVICTGTNQQPNLPKADRNGFSGTVLHSKDYRNADAFTGKRIVVVGLGETSADVVAELAAVASECTLSIRRGAYVIPRINPLTDYPNDYDSNRLRYALPKWAHDLAVTVCDGAYTRWGAARPSDRLRTALLRRPHTPAPFRQFATKSDNFIRALESNRCRLGGSFRGFTPNGVLLEGEAGDEEVKADVVLFATGFKAKSFDFLPDDAAGCPSHLWHLMYHKEHRERLVFVGFARPSLGALPPVSELQARYAALITSGERQLPSAPEMGRAIVERKRARVASFDDKRLVTLVDWIPYMDALADRIGCRPRLRDLLSRPRLCWQIVTGPMLVAQYRLADPDSTPELAARSLDLPGGMRLRDKLWYLSIHGLVAVCTPWEILPQRRRHRSCAIV